MLRQNSFFKLIKDGIVHGQRLALNSNFWSFAKESPKCDLLLVLNSQTDENREQSKAVAIWLVELLKKFAPQLSVRVKFHRLTSSYALYLSASYLSLLKGTELCHLKKPVKTCFGGGMRDFSVDCAHFFRDIENKDAFFSEMERSLIVKQIIEIIRSPHGGLRLTTSSLLSKPKRREVSSTIDNVMELSKFNTSANDNVVLDIPEGRTIFSTLYSTGTVKSVFPLHNTERLKKLESRWVYSFSFNQPIEEIKEYFGTEVALYFAWLSHLITSLWIPATIGMLMFAFGRSNFKLSEDSSDSSLISDICFVIFTIFNCVWSSTYLELWKRKQAELAFQWGTYEIRTDNPLINDIRPAFKGDKVVRNPISGRMEPHYTPWKHALIRFGLTYPATILCIVLVFIFLFLMLQIQQFAELHFKSSYFMKWIIYMPMIIQSVIILIADHMYRNLALFFNDLENYRTDEEYENFLISKIAIFQCINAFGSLFYIAFYLNDSTRLQETLATLLISRQVLQNVVEIAAPFVKEKFRLFHMTNKLTRSLSDNSLKKKVDEIRRDRNDKTGVILNSTSFSKSLDVETLEKNVLSSGEELRLRRVFGATSKLNSGDYKLTGITACQSHSERLPIPEFCPNESDVFEVSSSELQSMMTKYLRPLDDYLEMFIQFGYVVLFSPAFPLAAMCLLINIFVEMRVDAFKLCNTLQRPFGRRVRNIGAWQTAMQLMGILGVFVNCALISNNGLVHRLWPDLSLNGQLLLIIFLEHLIFVMRMLIDYLIPDVPYWIRVEAAKIEHWRREAYKNDLGLSICPTPWAEPRTPAKPYSRNHSGTSFSIFEKSRPASILLSNNTNMSNIFSQHYQGRKLLGKDDCASLLSASSPKIVKWYAFTEVEKEALRVSWQPILANLEEFGVEIYEMIFEQCPEARTLFPFMMVERETERGNKKRNSEFVFQALRFVQILETGITSLDDLSSMNLLLHNLGKRHGKLSSSECFRPYYWSVFLECAIHKLRKYIMRKCRRLFGGAPLDRDQVDRVIILWRHLLYGIIIRIEIGFDEDIANRKSSRQERGAGDSSQKWKYSDMTRESWKKTNNTSVIENSLQNLKPFKSMSNTNLCNASRSRSRDWFK